MKPYVSIWLCILCAAVEVTHCAENDYDKELSAPWPKNKALYLNSYLPPAMQVLAHLTGQLKFERPKGSGSTTTTTTTTSTSKPMTTTTTTKAPMDDILAESESTTPAHGPGIFAPMSPPIPERILPFKSEEIVPPIVDDQKDDRQPIFLPYETNLPILFYQNLKRAGYVPSSYRPDPEGYFPLVARSAAASDDLPDISALPVQNEAGFKANPLEDEVDELSEENLQYLSPDLRDMLRLQRDFRAEEPWTRESAAQSIENLYDETGDGKDVGEWLRLRKSPPSQTFIQMLLLYDLLSRDAKKQKLNGYNGYTEDMVKDLADTSRGTAGEQLKTLLERMIARGDCTHDFANNRAKELIAELEKPDSPASNEMRYLEPLRFAES